MIRRTDVRVVLVGWCVVGIALVGSAQPRPSRGRPARDTPAQERQSSTPAATGRMTGRVLAADTGRPVARARVLLSAAEIPGGRGTLSDRDGTFEFTELPSGRYTLTVAKSGFVSLSYGQRRPLQAGTPLQLNDGGHLRGIEFRLPRGSVISGHVFDEAGDPAPGASVRVLRYRYAQGVRQLVPSGSGLTDDRGAYRVWGLNPGDYYVAAVNRGSARPNAGPPGRGARGGPRPSDSLGTTGVETIEGLGTTDLRPDEAGYAPTYYPGVDSVESAQAVTVGLSAEILGIDFSLLLVRTSTISGRVTSAEGAVSTGSVTMVPEGLPGRGAAGAAFGARIQGDGAFAIASVPPGRYLIRAHGNDRDLPRFASMPLTVAGGDVSGVNLVVTPGASLSGTVSFRRTQLLSASPTQFSIVAPAPDGHSLGPMPVARVSADGTFRLDGVPAGEHWIRARTPRGWVVHAVTLDGRDITDAPLEVRSGQRVSGLRVVFTDALSEIAGVVTDDRGTPLIEHTVLAFPDDASLWHPLARQIMTARPDQTGRFQLRGLPAGAYLLLPIDPAEQGEWFEPAFLDEQRTRAVRVLLGDGETKTQDLTVGAR